MLLLGIFNEDIQMFCIRNPNYNIVDFIPGFMELAERSSRPNTGQDDKPQGTKNIQRILKGRMLWCASACCECLLA